MSCSSNAPELMLGLCPSCEGELLVDESSPKGGTPCPFCRTPLWCLRTPIDGGEVITFLPGSRHRPAEFGFSNLLSASLVLSDRLVVDLTRLHTVPGGLVDWLQAIHRSVLALGGRASVRAVHPAVVKAIEQAGMEVSVSSPLLPPETDLDSQPDNDIRAGWIPLSNSARSGDPEVDVAMSV